MLPALGSAVVGGVAPTYGGSGASEAWLQATIAYSFPMEKKTHSRPIALVIHGGAGVIERDQLGRSEEHTSELQSLMRIPYAVFCLQKKRNQTRSIQRNPYQTQLTPKTPPL